MTIPLAKLPVLHGAAALSQFLHIGGGLLGMVLKVLGGFLLQRLEFAAHYPASALTGLVVNALILWWLTRAPSQKSLRHGRWVPEVRP